MRVQADLALGVDIPGFRRKQMAIPTKVAPQQSLESVCHGVQNMILAGLTASKQTDNSFNQRFGFLFRVDGDSDPSPTRRHFNEEYDGECNDSVQVQRDADHGFSYGGLIQDNDQYLMGGIDGLGCQWAKTAWQSGGGRDVEEGSASQCQRVEHHRGEVIMQVDTCICVSVWLVTWEFVGICLTNSRIVPNVSVSDQGMTKLIPPLIQVFDKPLVCEECDVVSVHQALGFEAEVVVSFAEDDEQGDL